MLNNKLFALVLAVSAAVVPTTAFAQVTEAGPGSADDNVTLGDITVEDVLNDK